MAKKRTARLDPRPGDILAKNGLRREVLDREDEELGHVIYGLDPGMTVENCSITEWVRWAREAEILHPLKKEKSN